MNAALKVEHLSVEDYLAGEELSDIRHDYISGTVYAMGGRSEEHGIITGNLCAALHGHLRGKRCRAFVADMKVRLLLRGEDVFYYPDILVTCDPRDTHRYYKQFPSVLIEVMSASTERIDRREKRWSYLQLESLEEYVLVAQDKMEVTIYRRANDWAAEILQGPQAILTLASLEFSLLYEGVPV